MKGRNMLKKYIAIAWLTICAAVCLTGFGMMVAYIEEFRNMLIFMVGVGGVVGMTMWSMDVLDRAS